MNGDDELDRFLEREEARAIENATREAIDQARKERMARQYRDALVDRDAIVAMGQRSFIAEDIVGRELTVWLSVGMLIGFIGGCAFGVLAGWLFL